ncbi:MAG: 23S rRNA (pseudouridine(1915)-N(3))-methyltransferase RlmH [Hyphomicrobiaceae bacterium]|nr:23S rRNA (pseudouridine(1915)-N(3))-methyltransferase RlmH [Hyphomicrobiaceae bacterium]
MRIVIAAVGRLKDGPERELYRRYVGRYDGLGRGLGLKPVSLKEIAESRADNATARAADEARRLVEASDGAALRVALDETGKVMSSETFAAWLGEQRDRIGGDVAFLLGGPDGHGPAVRESARLTLSLGAMTFPHGLARVLLVEQFYRAATIMAGHPYHRS